MTTLVHLLRHASHGHLGRVLTGRQPGIPLTPAGHAEAQALGRHMAKLGVDVLFTSPRRRARESAWYVARESGALCRIAPELDEIDFGHWTGMTFDALSSDPRWRHWNEARDMASTPAGETMRDVAARVAGLIGRLQREFPHGALGLVTHSDVIKATICHYQGWSFNRVHSFEIGPATVSTLALRNSGSDLIARNVTPAPVHAEEVPA